MSAGRDLTDALIEAQAELQTGIGFFRLGSTGHGLDKLTDDRLSEALHQLHAILAERGWTAAQYREVDEGFTPEEQREHDERERHNAQVWTAEPGVAGNDEPDERHDYEA